MSPLASLGRAVTVLAVSLTLGVLGSGAADAHVGVSSPDASPGGFGKVVLRVPSESDTARTTSVTVRLPADTPFRFVSTKAMPGWHATTTTARLDKPVESDGFKLTKAVNAVTWTSDRASALEPHEFAEFELSLGPFPKDATELTFPTIQRYSDGENVTWNQPTPASGAEPEHPAPTLTLAGSGQARLRSVVNASPTEVDAGEADVMARVLGGLGLALGLVALGLVVTNGRRRRA